MQGALAGLLTGLTSLNCSELTLKKVYYRNGIAGLDKLLTLLITDWLADIRQNQIPQILGGVGPMHSVLQLLQGVKDLVLMPVEQYQVFIQIVLLSTNFTIFYSCLQY